MNYKRRSRFFLVAIVLLVSVCLLLAVALLASQALSFRGGFLQRSGDNELSLRYQTFTASEEKHETLEAGDTLVLDYKVAVTKGTLTVSVLAPDGEPVWELTLREDENDRVRIPIVESGVYTIRFRGEDSGGRTDLSWKVETS